MPNGTPTPKQLAIITAIGGSETDFSRKQAYSEEYNKPTQGKFANPNVARAGMAGADYGYYQMNQEQIHRAIMMGMAPERAASLTGGGKGGTTPLESQTAAMHEYLNLKYPSYRSGDFETFQKEAAGEWHGLSRAEGAPARGYYERALPRTTTPGVLASTAQVAGTRRTTPDVIAPIRVASSDAPTAASDRSHYRRQLRAPNNETGPI